MRLTVTHPQGKALRRTAEGDAALAAYLRTEIADAFAASHPLHQLFTTLLRLYEAVPAQAMRNAPIEGVPVLEIALGAIAADAVYAQFIDTIFSVSPFLTVRAQHATLEAAETARALQRRVNIGATSEWGLRRPIEQACLDCVQLGTGVLVVPFVETITQTDIQRVTERGPRPQAWPIEDVVVPGGSTDDVQRLPWIALRSWLAPGPLALRARRERWETTDFQPQARPGFVRSQRENLSRSRSAPAAALCEVLEWWGTFDYDGDGIDEDLYVVWDRTAEALGKVTYAGYDRRPIAEPMRYQRRAYVFHGVGVMEMVRPMQEAVTEFHVEYLVNAKLASLRMWAAREGVVEDTTLHAWHNKVFFMPNPAEDLRELRMGEIHPSLAQAIAMHIGFAERRVGINDMALPRASQVLGSRTPGITALSLLQQVNRRFAPAFDAMRLAIADAVRHCLYREQERLLQGDPALEDHLRRLLGPADGERVIRLLRDPHFDEQLTVELTASSASVNRLQDRQDALQVMTLLLSQYYPGLLKLAEIAANPQVASPVRDLAAKVGAAATRAVERVLATHDTVRDPHTFLVDIGSEVEALQQNADLGTLGTLWDLLQGAEGAGAVPMENGAPVEMGEPAPEVGSP